MDINYFMKIQNAYGTKNKREKELVKINSQMTKHFEDTYDTEDVLLNGEPFKLMIIKDTDGNTFKKKIKSPHGNKFNLGDYVEWNSQIWLITLIDSDDKTWNRGYMYQCTILLRWQNTKGEIIERYGYTEDFTKYTRGLNGNDIITVGDFQYGVTLPVDEETKLIKRDKRFVIDIDGVEPPDVYKLTNRKILLTDNRYFDRGGILTWTLSFSEFNYHTDVKVTLENGTQAWICDYILPSPTLPSSGQVPVLNVMIAGNKNIKVGFSRIFTATLCNSDGKEIPWDSESYSWDIISDFTVNQIIKNNTIELFINDESLIGGSFLLSVKNKDEILVQERIKVIEGF